MQSDPALGSIDGATTVDALIADDIIERVAEEHPPDLRTDRQAFRDVTFAESQQP